MKFPNNLMKSLSPLNSLPTNVYHLSQKDFGAIPSNPWVYWLSKNIRNLFIEQARLENIAQPRQGLATADNLRFIRFWWEIGENNIGLYFQNRENAKSSRFKWFPISKGSKTHNWAGAEFEVINWGNDGNELFMFEGSVIRSPEFYFKPGITLTRVGPSGFSARYNPAGQILDSSNSGSFPDNPSLIFSLLGILNSRCTSVLLSAMNPTINFQVGDLNNLPLPNLKTEQAKTLNDFVSKTIFLTRRIILQNENTINFIAPLPWKTGLTDLSNFQERIGELERQIDNEVFSLYKISPEDRVFIDKELTGEALSEIEENSEDKTSDEEDSPQTVNPEELASHWISYSIGAVLGKFKIGKSRKINPATKNEKQTLGNAIYYREDFAIGSLPAPSEEEFNELVGAPETFAYIDEQGGRHIFPREVEKSLRALVFEDGISVLDEGHPRDLASRVEKALVLMLGEQGTSEVIQALGGEASGAQAFLRQFLGKDYFTKWHFKWYRKRPIYWAIQSAKRSYGFVIFHEKITRDTFYAIQRDPYLDTKRNAISLKMGDLQGSMSTATGSTRKRLEKELDGLQKVSAELEEFAKDLESITMGGYNPSPEWIDDGVILRMAPLWKVIPIWKAEPKKYWERLEAGDFDWSRIAMNYWSDRVKAKCKTNKSYAIAHGHEEWYQGG